MSDKPYLPHVFRYNNTVVDMYGRLVATCTNEKDTKFIVEAIEHFIKSKETTEITSNRTTEITSDGTDPKKINKPYCEVVAGSRQYGETTTKVLK